MNIDNKTAKASTSDLRKFGFIMGGMFALMFGLIFPWLGKKTAETWPIWPFIVAGVFWVVALIAPKVLRPINDIWEKVGNILGFINSRIILGIMFFVLFLPLGLLLRALGKDGMKRQYDKEANSYRKLVTPRDRDNLEKPF